MRGPGPGPMGKELVESMDSPIIQAMNRHGITIDRLMQQLEDELIAEDTKIGFDKGKIIDTKQVPAHDIRQRARIDAHKLRGDYPATGVNVQASGEHTVKIVRFSDE